MTAFPNPLPLLPACVNQIREARFRFRGMTGTEPSTLYLGKKDWKELGEWVGWALDEDRLFFDGLPIFVVDAERHVGVG